MKVYRYIPTGVCSKEILYWIEGDIIKNVQIVGGCPGNSLGVCALAKNQPIDDVIKKLKGIDCRNRGTSCPDQLAIGLIKIKNNELEEV